MSRYVAVNELPPTLRAALKTLGYRRKDIQVKAQETYSMAHGGMKGCQSFTTMVSLATGEAHTSRGSWGGANPFNPNNAVDLDTATRLLPEGYAVITGTTGYKGMFADIAVNPANLAKLLPSATSAELTDSEKKAIEIFCRYKSSYRREGFDREGLGEYGPENPTVKALVSKGLLKVLGNGGLTVTTAGRNARSV